MVDNTCIELRKLDKRTDIFRKNAYDIRSIGVLNTLQADRALLASSGDASAARASLLGHREAAPHERGLRSDRHITGGVGGQDRSGPSRELWGGANRSPGDKRYSQPMTRAFRPTNAKGQTSFYMEFTCINQANLSCGLPVKGGVAVRPDTHVSYIEAIEKRDEATVDRPIKGGGYAQYQERELAVGNDEVESVLTNIAGSQANRIRLFQKAEAFEPTTRLPKLTVCVRDDNPLPISACRFLLESGSVPETFKFLANADGSQQLIVAVEGETAIAGYNMLKKDLGWHEGKAHAALGISWDPGKSGRVQMRIVGELPREVDQAARARICAHVVAPFKERRIPYVLAMHRPTPGNHKHNWHFHLSYYDRPTEAFDPTALKDQLEAGIFPVERYNKRYAGHIAAALADPAVCKQAGKFDFEVEYTYCDERGRDRTIRPFVQNKDRSLTRKNFVMEQRDRMSQITNLELERAGAHRRVKPERHADFGIVKQAGIHLGYNKMKLELAGSPTAEGMLNEQHQSDYLDRAIQARHQQAIFVADTDISQTKWALARDGQPEGYRLLEAYDAHQRAVLDARLISDKAVAQNKRLFSRTTKIVKYHLSFLREHEAKSDCPKQAEKNKRHLEALTEARGHAAAIAKLFADDLHIVRDARRIVRRESQAAEAIMIAFENKARGETVTVEQALSADLATVPPAIVAPAQPLLAGETIVAINAPIKAAPPIARILSVEVNTVTIGQPAQGRSHDPVPAQAVKVSESAKASVTPPAKPIEIKIDWQEKERARKFRSALDNWAKGYLDAKIEVEATAQSLVVTGNEKWVELYPKPLLAKTDHERARLSAVGELVAKRMAVKQAGILATDRVTPASQIVTPNEITAKAPTAADAVVARPAPPIVQQHPNAKPARAGGVPKSPSVDADRAGLSPAPLVSKVNSGHSSESTQRAKTLDAERIRRQQIARIFDLWPAGYLDVDVDRRGGQVWLKIRETKKVAEKLPPQLQIVTPEEHNRLAEALRVIAWENDQAEQTRRMASQQTDSAANTNGPFPAIAAAAAAHMPDIREQAMRVDENLKREAAAASDDTRAGDPSDRTVPTTAPTSPLGADKDHFTKSAEATGNPRPAQFQPSQTAEELRRPKSRSPVAQKEKSVPPQSQHSVAALTTPAESAPFIEEENGARADNEIESPAPHEISHGEKNVSPGIPVELSLVLKYIKKHDLEIVGDQKSGLKVRLPLEMSDSVELLKTRLAQVSLNTSYAEQAKIRREIQRKIADRVNSANDIEGSLTELKGLMLPGDRQIFERVARWSAFPEMLDMIKRQKQEAARDLAEKCLAAAKFNDERTASQLARQAIEAMKSWPDKSTEQAIGSALQAVADPKKVVPGAVHAALHQLQLEL